MKIVTLVFITFISFWTTTASAENLNLTLSGGSPGGLWSLLGAGLDKAVKESNPESVITYQATAGGFANIALLTKGRTDLGLVHDAEITVALAGRPPFKSPVSNLRAIGYMYNWAPMHFFLNKAEAEKYGINSIEDIATSKAPISIGINRSGNITSDIALFMLEQAGLDSDTLKDNGGRFVRAGSREQTDLIQDGRISMATNGIFVGHSSFRAIDRNTDVILLDIPQTVIDATNQEFGTSAFTIPKNSYSKQGKDVSSIALGALVVTTEKMSNKAAYELAKSLATNINQISSIHKAMGKLNAELMVSQKVLTFHPGAERAFKEAGLLK